ncbi:MAG: T9SS type A sorting domain-containing protein [Bacteroidota bacterium]
MGLIPSMNTLRLTIFYFIISCPLIALSQSLNERYHFSLSASVANSIAVTDSSYYVSAVVIDTLAIPTEGALLANINLDGSVNWNTLLSSEQEDYTTWLGDLVDLGEAGFVVNGTGLDSTRNALVIRYASNGDLLWAKKIRNLFDGQSFIRSQGLIRVNENELLHIAWEDDPQQGNAEGMGVAKLDIDGNIIWRRVWGDPELREIPTSLAYLDEDNYLVGGSQTDNNLFTQNQKYRAIVFKVNDIGHQGWEWKSPPNELWDAVHALVSSGDGGVIGASGKGKHIYVNPNVDNVSWVNMTIFKINAQRQLEWETDFYPSNFRSLDNKLNEVIALSDESGFVAVGQYLQMYFDITDPIGVPASDVHGLIVKVAPNGDSLWTRRLNYIEEIGRFDHFLYDIEETPDGGFVLCGQVKDASLTTQRQQAWLLKVDKHGCLVPGCQLPTSTTAPTTELATMLLYPNPAQDQLYVFVKENNATSKQQRWLRMLNMQGQLIATYQNIGAIDEITHIIPVNHLKAGTYILQYGTGNNTISSKSFIKH